jgi:hypothetical protein
MSFAVKTTWKEVKSFLDETQLFLNLNYKEFEAYYMIWTEYEGLTMYTQIDKSDVQIEDFLTNYAPKTQLKKTIMDGGLKYTGSFGVSNKKWLQRFCYQGGLSTITPAENFYSSYILDRNGNVITDPTQAIFTCIRFEPNFDYDIISGGLTFLEGNGEHDIYINVIGNPDIPESMGGSVKIILNEKYNHEPVMVQSLVAMPLVCIEGYHTNVILIKVHHSIGLIKTYQVQLSFYAS